MNPRVRHVIPQKDFTLILTFTNNQMRKFDMAPYLKKGIFKTLAEWKIFNKAKIAFGTVIWPGDLDISPDTLYLESKPWQESHPYV